MDHHEHAPGDGALPSPMTIGELRAKVAKLSEEVKALQQRSNDDHQRYLDLCLEVAKIADIARNPMGQLVGLVSPPAVATPTVPAAGARRCPAVVDPDRRDLNPGWILQCCLREGHDGKHAFSAREVEPELTVTVPMSIAKSFGLVLPKEEPKEEGSDGEPSFTCPECSKRSYNPGDIANRYCGKCCRFYPEG